MDELLQSLKIETDTRISIINKSVLESHQRLFAIIENLTKEIEALKAENKSLKNNQNE